MLLENPDLFIAHYFRHKLQQLKDFHLRLIESATRFRFALVLYPAFHGKTTLVSTCLPVWQVARNPDIRIGIIAKNEKDASGIMTSIHAELQDNTELVRDFGPFRPDKTSGKRWAQYAIDVEHRTLRSPRPTVQVYGSGGNVFGHRTDWTICDDVVTDKNSWTPEQREKLRDWFTQGVRTMPEERDDRLTVVGTRFHPEDLYGDLSEERHPDTDAKLWHVQYEDAIVDEEEKRTLWEERWPWDALQELKASQGTLSFNKRLRNIAVDPSRLVFREEYVRGGWVGTNKYPGCLDRAYTVGDISDDFVRYGGFDPAIGTVRGHSWSVMTTVMVGACAEHERCYWVVDQERGQLTINQQADLVLATHDQYGCLVSKIETNGYQKGLKELVDERMRRSGKVLRIEPHLTRAENKTDPEVGVQAMAPYFERGFFHIPWGDPLSQRKMSQLVRELIEFPGGRTDDCVMSLWIAWLNARDSQPRWLSFNRRSGRPLQVGARQVPLGTRIYRNPYYDTPGEEVA